MTAIVPCLGCGEPIPKTDRRCPDCRAEKRAAEPRRPGTGRYDTPAWRALSRQVIQRDGCCQHCGATTQLLAHHIVPRSQGGQDHEHNCVTLCRTCHPTIEAQGWP